MAIKGRQLSAWRSRNRAGIGGSDVSAASLAQLSTGCFVAMLEQPPILIA
jgi:hypothetical protein